jgi:hypothetical protein
MWWDQPRLRPGPRMRFCPHPSVWFRLQLPNGLPFDKPTEDLRHTYLLDLVLIWWQASLSIGFVDFSPSWRLLPSLAENIGLLKAYVA